MSGTRGSYQAGLLLAGFVAAFALGVQMHLSFTERYRAHLAQIVGGTSWTERQKICALLGAPRWVPAWRLALCISTFFTLLLALMWCFGFEAHGPANWILMFMLFFMVSNFSQTYRATHAEGDAAYLASRLLDPNKPHETFWKELLVLEASSVAPKGLEG